MGRFVVQGVCVVNVRLRSFDVFDVCSPEAVAAALTLYTVLPGKARPDVFIGPACTTACEKVAMLAEAWSMPLISYAAAGPMLTHNKYPNFLRTNGNYASMNEFIVQLCKHFKWNQVSILFAARGDLWPSTAGSLRQALQNAGINVPIYESFIPISNDTYRSGATMRPKHLAMQR